MQAFLIYILKTAIYSGIFFLYYFLVLRNKQFHYYNRFYLLMSVVLSLVLPFVNLEVWTWHSGNEEVIDMMNVMLVNTSVEAKTGNSGFAFSAENMVMLAGGLVVLYFLGKLVISILKIYRFKKNYPQEKVDDITFITTDLPQAPFSFFNNLFWKDSLALSSNTSRQILRHEITHIQQKHSWDKLFMRLLTAVFWLNPFYWFIQKELGMTHEFIADEKAIENKDAEAFALMLLQAQYSKAIFSPAQSFSYSPIKRRLVMLTTSTKPSFSYARRVMILPLLAITILLFAFKISHDEQPTVTGVNAPFTLVVDAGHGGDDAGAHGLNNVLEKDFSLSLAKKIQDLAPQYGITIRLTRKSDKTVSLHDRMSIVKAEQPDACISLHTEVNTETKTEKNGMEMYIPRDNAKPTQTSSRLLGSSVLHELQSQFVTNTSLLQRKSKGIYIIDMNPYPSVLLECGYINNENDNAQLRSDEKMEQMAKNILQGVVAYANADKAAVIHSLQDTTAKPLYVVNGKVLPDEDFKKIQADSIRSINVLKGEAAVNKYGDEGENGVIEIQTNKGFKSNNNYNPDTSGETSDLTSNAKSVMVSALKNPKSERFEKALKIVDGKTISNDMFQKLDLQVDSPMIIILNRENALKKYGSKGENGVIEIIHNKSNTLLNLYRGSAEKDSLIKPSFPGGVQAWTQYLQRNLHSDIVTKKGGPAGKYTVIVAFKVAADGKISDVHALNDPGYGTGAEAARVIQQGPDWIPAKQEGEPLAVETKQSITWVVTDEKSKKPDSYEKVFNTTQQPPSFTGGEKAWDTYLQKHANAEVPTDNQAPTGKYVATVSFQVNADGTISNVRAVNNPGYGTAAEAVRVIQQSPNWIPAKQNGKPVSAVVKKDITFVVVEN